jgi:hypothetical protein
MTKKESPLSIKIIYWLTEVIYFMSAILALGAIGLFIWSLFGPIPESLNLHLQSPYTFELETPGTYHLEGITQELNFTEINGRIGFQDTPTKIVHWMTTAIFIGAMILFMVVRSFRAFVRVLRSGSYFDPRNVGRLKHMALWILVFWVFNKVYFIALGEFLRDSLYLDGMEIIGVYDTGSVEIFVALFLWVLSHIFQQGMEIQNENELTV